MDGDGAEESEREREEQGGAQLDHAESLSCCPPVCMRTRWPSPTSTSSPALSSVQPYGARHSCGKRAAPSSTAARSSLRFKIGVRHGGEEAERVRVQRILEQYFARRDLDDAAAAHDGDLVGDVVDHREIVRDEEIGEAELGLQVLQEVQDLRLDGNVERRYGLVAQHEIGLQRERAGDADPLALAAGKAVRIAVEEARVEPDEPHQLLRHLRPVVGIADLMDHERLAQDVEHRHPRAERAERVLENVLDAPAEAHQRLAIGLDDVDHRPAIVEQHLPAIGLERAHDHLRQRRLAAAAFADEAEALAARNGRSSRRRRRGTSRPCAGRKGRRRASRTIC